MKLLVVGSGKPGSFEIRGHQLGGAIGARVTAVPTHHDFAWAECVVFVKRGKSVYQGEAQRRGLPIVWDALDFWSQPLENPDSEATACARLTNHIRALNPATVIGATRAQALAAGWLGRYLPHHSWPGLTPGEVRPELRTVAYQGNPAYLGAWGGRLTRLCQARGWTFEVNPADLRTADVLVALRDGPWDGWACRRWKSGVKLVNAIAAGRPILTQASGAWEDIQPPGTVIETELDLEAALLAWRDPERRRAAARACALLAPEYSLATVAKRYDAILTTTEGVAHV